MEKSYSENVEGRPIAVAIFVLKSGSLLGHGVRDNNIINM